MAADTDRIEKKIVLRASRERVWTAITDAKQFGSWFGAQFDSPFVPGTWVTGGIAPTKVDAEVAKMQEPYAGMACNFMIERIEPMSLFSFHWHPSAVDPDAVSRKNPQLWLPSSWRKCRRERS